MKPTVAIALIVTGGVIVLVPPLSDYLFLVRVTELMKQPGVNGVSVDLKMGDLYRIGCWFLGAGMVLMAVLGSRGTRASATEK